MAVEENQSKEQMDTKLPVLKTCLYSPRKKTYKNINIFKNNYLTAIEDNSKILFTKQQILRVTLFQTTS